MQREILTDFRYSMTFYRFETIASGIEVSVDCVKTHYVDTRGCRSRFMNPYSEIGAWDYVNSEMADIHPVRLG